MNTLLWTRHEGRELDTTPLPDKAKDYAVVACLNVWNDVNALQRTVPSWQHMVDHVIVVDGSYNTTGEMSLSTDGTREFLESTFKSIEFVDAAGLSQCEKRTKYLERGNVGDYLFVVDADEFVFGTALRYLPECDIGWVRIQSTLYTREYGQPRIFKWRPGLTYHGRHHWVYEGSKLFCTHQYGGSGFNHRIVDLRLSNERGLGHSTARRTIKNRSMSAQYPIEATLSATTRSVMSDSAVQAREALRILQHVFRDDGLAPSRFHTAINRTTPHSSTFFKIRPGPFGVSTQYDVQKDFRMLTLAEHEADVIHVHAPALNIPRRYNVPYVLHHHGTRFRNRAERWNDEARRRNALVLVSNLELLSWTGDYPAEFLPNVVPVSRYLALAEVHRTTLDHGSPFRVAHSPSVREKKGTQHFLAVCDRLRQRGYPIEPVLIEGLDHDQALIVKASCHASFDSFWLGIQCSGLECAAMGLPVIAGDITVARRYREYFGDVPYTFAADEEELEVILRALMDDPQFYTEEAARVHSYVLDNHDESAVALTYLDMLDRKFGWRSVPVKRGGSRQLVCK